MGNRTTWSHLHDQRAARTYFINLLSLLGLCLGVFKKTTTTEIPVRWPERNERMCSLLYSCINLKSTIFSYFSFVQTIKDVKMRLAWQKLQKLLRKTGRHCWNCQTGNIFTSLIVWKEENHSKSINEDKMNVLSLKSTMLYNNHTICSPETLPFKISHF